VTMPPPPPRPPAPPSMSAPATKPVAGFTLDLTPRAARSPVPRIVYYGVEGFGKTTFACQAPNPVVLAARDERGVQRLLDSGAIGPTPVIDCVDWPTTMNALESLAHAKHDRKTVIMDSLVAFERLCHEHLIATVFNGKPGDDGFMSFGKGPRQALTEWAKIMQRLDTLNRAGMTIILLGHSYVEKFKNPDGNDFDRYSCNMDKLAWGSIKAWADCVWFGNYLTITKDQGQGKSVKSKGIGGTDRVVYTNRRDTHDAKPGYTMPHEIHLSGDPSNVWEEVTKYVFNKESA